MINVFLTLYLCDKMSMKHVMVFGTQRLHYKFIRCVETNTNAWESCVKKYGGEKAINDCYNGDLSKEVGVHINKTLIIIIYIYNFSI